MPRKVDGWTLSGSSEDKQPEFKKNLKDYVYIQKNLYLKIFVNKV